MHKWNEVSAKTAIVAVGAVAWDPNGRLICAGGGTGFKGCLMFWDAKTFESEHHWINCDFVRKVAFSHRHKFLAVGDERGSVSIRRFPSGKLLAQCPLGKQPGTSTRIGCLSFSENDELLAGGFWDLYARVWDAKDGKIHFAAGPHDGNVDFVAFLRGDKQLITGTYGELRVYDLHGELEKKISLSSIENGFCWAHCLSGDRAALVSVSEKGLLIFWNTIDWTCSTIQLSIEGSPLLAAAPHGDVFVVSIEEKGLLVANFSSKEVARKIMPPQEGVIDVALSPDGKSMVAEDQANIRGIFLRGLEI